MFPHRLFAWFLDSLRGQTFFNDSNQHNPTAEELVHDTRFRPLTNIDGIPMLNDLVDVTGKAYGEVGSLFDAGCAGLNRFDTFSNSGGIGSLFSSSIDYEM